MANPAPRFANLAKVTDIRFEDGDLAKLGSFIAAWSNIPESEYQQGTALWFCERMDMYAAVFATFAAARQLPRCGVNGLPVILQPGSETRKYQYLRLARAMLACHGPYVGWRHVTCERLAEISPDYKNPQAPRAVDRIKWLERSVPGQLPVNVFQKLCLPKGMCASMATCWRCLVEGEFAAGVRAAVAERDANGDRARR